MAQTIWKTILKSIDEQVIEVPGGAEMLHVRDQHSVIAIWYRCDPAEEKKPRKILICGTGHAAPTDAASLYIGTVSLQGGTLILHVFERTANE